MKTCSLISINMALLIALLFLYTLMLLQPNKSIQLANSGLLLWFNHMIPALFPTMVWTDFMIRSGKSHKASLVLQPVLGKILSTSLQGTFTVIMGFLGGFPIGAKCVSQMYITKQITKDEASYLLSFCNNLGPIYTLCFIVPFLQYKYKGFILFCMYGIPFLYGIIMRYTIYRKEIFVSCNTESNDINNLLSCLDFSLEKSLYNIAMLGGYIIIFQLPFLFISNDSVRKYVGCFIEINNGLSFISDNLFSLLHCCIVLAACSFTGMCCFSQTVHILKNTDLSVMKYLKHKIIQAILVFLVSYVYFSFYS